ncbi:MAG: phage portal protein [Anaerovoracaceae bacterium]
MLQTNEIAEYIKADLTSPYHSKAREGQRYYEGMHDIRNSRVFFYDEDGELVEDTSGKQSKISHTFFTELVDQKAQYQLSGKSNIVRSDDPALQSRLNEYFDDSFKSELNDLITYTAIEGFSYVYANMTEEGRLEFVFAEGMNVVEIEAKRSSDGKAYIIYYYRDKTADDKEITRIRVYSESDVTYYIMSETKDVSLDETVSINPRPHIIYKDAKTGKMYGKSFGFIPFWRFDNNKKRTNDLSRIKDLIDDYDIHACGMSDNLINLTDGYFVVKGFEGSNLSELVHNVKTKKVVGVGENGGVEVHTVNIPYDARVKKMEITETNIYRFGMGFNSAQVGDGNITNVVIKSRYALLDLKCNKLEEGLRKFLKKLILVALEQINEIDKKGYSLKDVYLVFDREIITNEIDKAQIKKAEAETAQVQINSLLNTSNILGAEVVAEQICAAFNIDYNNIKSKMPKEQSAESLLDKLDEGVVE